MDSSLPTEICGENGNIKIDQIHIARKVTLRPHGVPQSGRAALPEEQVIGEGLEYDEYYYEFKEFIDTVEGGLGESPVNSLETSLLNARLMDAIKCG